MPARFIALVQCTALKTLRQPGFEAASAEGRPRTWLMPILKVEVVPSSFLPLPRSPSRAGSRGRACIHRSPCPQLAQPGSSSAHTHTAAAACPSCSWSPGGTHRYLRRASCGGSRPPGSQCTAQSRACQTGQGPGGHKEKRPPQAHAQGRCQMSPCLLLAKNQGQQQRSSLAHVHQSSCHYPFQGAKLAHLNNTFNTSLSLHRGSCNRWKQQPLA